VQGSISARPFGRIDSPAANVVLPAKQSGAFVLKPDRLHELIAIRTALGLSQSAMAHLLELTTREYQAFEWGECEIPNLYILSAERIAMAHAVLHGAPMKAPPALREEALALVRLMESAVAAEPSA
jgi:DNA-binding XRE family transcriptional regulator